MTIDAFRLGQTVIRLRKQAGLSQQELADKAGLTHRTVLAALEQGRRVPLLTTSAAIADALGVTVDDLIRDAR